MPKALPARPHNPHNVDGIRPRPAPSISRPVRAATPAGFDRSRFRASRPAAAAPPRRQPVSLRPAATAPHKLSPIEQLKAKHAVSPQASRHSIRALAKAVVAIEAPKTPSAAAKPAAPAVPARHLPPMDMELPGDTSPLRHLDSALSNGRLAVFR
ncbi:MAG TPA: hypothetical protein VM535_01070, partial [Candidatus Saccharimonadales bacterium]|nr:hypothetical protein [Candidatus Saccharimonadales bacterium]